MNNRGYSESTQPLVLDKEYCWIYANIAALNDQDIIYKVIGDEPLMEN